MTGNYGYTAGVNIEAVTVLGVTSAPNGMSSTSTYNATTQVLTTNMTIPLTGDATIQVGGGTGMVAPYTGAGTRHSWSLKGIALVVRRPCCFCETHSMVVKVLRVSGGPDCLRQEESMQCRVGIKSSGVLVEA